jgi:hypothetical protein
MQRRRRVSVAAYMRTQASPTQRAGRPSVKGNKLLQMLKMGRAALGDTRPKLGEHREVHFQS